MTHLRKIVGIVTLAVLLTFAAAPVFAQGGAGGGPVEPSLFSQPTPHEYERTQV